MWLTKKIKVFMHGSEGVGEKDSYDHVGVKISIFLDDTSHVEEKREKPSMHLL